MKNFPILCSLILLLLTSCNSEPAADRDPPPNESVTETPTKPEASDLSGYVTVLQGIWKRNSYPYGEIIFKGKQIKFAAGEGLPEEPQFTDYKLAETCPTAQSNMPARSAYDFVILTAEDNCSAVRLRKDRFLIYYGGSPVEYVRKNAKSAKPGEELGEEIQGDTDRDIARIRDMYQQTVERINAGGMRKETKEATCQNTEGTGRLVLYADDNEVVMTEYTEGIGHSFTTTRMYFADGKLFFAFIEDEAWSFAGTRDAEGNPGVDSEITEHRYYLKDGKVIRRLEKSFSYRNWTDDPKSDAIPNKTVQPVKGGNFPSEDFIRKLKKGVIDC